MPWPKATDFIEAVQDLRGSADDEELRGGEVVRTPLGLPMLWSGNFADVFKIDCRASGNTWALKCFTREVAGQCDRYRRIAAHLEQAQLPFTVDFRYLEQGVRIGGRWFPALKMRWVEGLTLAEFVEEHLDRPGNLKMLLDLWVKLAARLREAGIAHADLQHGNVILVPMSGGSLALRLIDYDGMYVPSLAGTRSNELGHPAYQHPQRLREETYNGEVDRFSHLAIYCGIRCLMLGRWELWQQFNNGDNLLFREDDFRNPGGSNLFRVLWEKLQNSDARGLLGWLVLACEKRLEEVPLLDEIVAEGKVQPLSSEQQAAVDALLAPAAKMPAKPVSEDDVPLEWLMQSEAERQAAQPPVVAEVLEGQPASADFIPPTETEAETSEIQLATAGFVPLEAAEAEVPGGRRMSADFIPATGTEAERSEIQLATADFVPLEASEIEVPKGRRMSANVVPATETEAETSEIQPASADFVPLEATEAEVPGGRRMSADVVPGAGIEEEARRPWAVV